MSERESEGGKEGKEGRAGVSSALSAQLAASEIPLAASKVKVNKTWLHCRPSTFCPFHFWQEFRQYNMYLNTSMAHVHTLALTHNTSKVEIRIEVENFNSNLVLLVYV